jgi:hypothetical protein
MNSNPTRRFQRNFGSTQAEKPSETTPTSAFVVLPILPAFFSTSFPTLGFAGQAAFHIQQLLCVLAAQQAQTKQTQANATDVHPCRPLPSIANGSQIWN